MLLFDLILTYSGLLFITIHNFYKFKSILQVNNDFIN